MRMHRTTARIIPNVKNIATLYNAACSPSVSFCGAETVSQFEALKIGKISAESVVMVTQPQP